jgi:Protein of unknown function (DUF512)./Radical SAM superfamily.
MYKNMRGKEMKTAPVDYIIRIVQQTNILPVTSMCSTGCVFCSHKNNPRDVDVYMLPNLSTGQIKEIAGFLDSSRKIVIGESASRIMEGEPFLREDIKEILGFLRSRYPKAPIEITTSGTCLSLDMVRFLKSIEPVEINISLNSSSEAGRNLLFKGRDIDKSIPAIEYLKNEKVEFNGSIVAMPDVVGYSDIEETINFLCINGATVVRVFVPGFSKLSSFVIDFDSTRSNLQTIADRVYEKYDVPVLVEPPEIENLNAEVGGVLKGSPAHEAGLLKGDIILRIGDYIPLTRVDAYNTLYKKGSMGLKVKRGENIQDLYIKKNSSKSPGAVFYYDIDPYAIYGIERAIIKYRSKQPAIVTSKLGFPLISMGIQKLMGNSSNIISIENKWFGGSIMCSGLLTVEDIVNGVLEENGKKAIDLIIVPPAPFDINGRDLQGRHYTEIEEKTGIRTVVVEW